MNKGGLEQWLQHLEHLHPTGMELGLERVERVAQGLDLLSPAVPVVTVAGTNGKGSTVAVLEALLLAAGKRPGAFTSPHFLRFNERIHVAGEEADDAEIVTALEAIESARGEISLTYFEFATLAALWIFRRRAVDTIVLEVGLGGRLDATNIIDPTVAVITSIALDHQAWLGDSLGQIAREKAGIVRQGRPLVVADPDPPPALLDCAASADVVPLLLYGRNFGPLQQNGAARLAFVDQTGAADSLALPAVDTLLPQNLCAAVQAAALLEVNISDEGLERALAGLQLTGRREIRHAAGLDYVLDVAHNPASVMALLEMLRASHCRGRTLALFSAMGDKDLREMLTPALEIFDGWLLADQPGNQRAATAGEIAELLRGLGVSGISASDNLQQAFRRAQGLMSGGDRLVVFGSFHTVAAVLPLLEKDRLKSLAGAVS